MTKNFHPKRILDIREALKNDSAGNKPCTMTDLDAACDMLSELMSMKDSEYKLYNLCKEYFDHPNKLSKTKKKSYRKIIRDLFDKCDRFLIDKN